MTSAVAVKPASLPPGSTLPAITCAPDGGGVEGREAIELAALTGLILTPWQCHVLEVGLRVRDDGTWAASEVGLSVARQNGKSKVLEALCLYGLFVLRDPVTLYSAHEFKTAKLQFERILELIDGTPELSARMSKTIRNPSEFGFDTVYGSKLRFLARSGGSGRGYTANRVIYDEAFKLDAASLGATTPTMKTVRNKQSWYASSAAWATSDKLQELRRQALKGSAPRLAYFDYSAPDDDVRAITSKEEMYAAFEDGRGWKWAAAANPVLGEMILHEAILDDLQSMPLDMFIREDLGVPDVPVGEGVFPEGAWGECEEWPVRDRPSKVTFAVEVLPDHSRGSILAAGRRADGRILVELVEDQPGTAWIVPKLRDLKRKWRPDDLVLDPSSAAGSLIRDLDDERIGYRKFTTREFMQASGAFYDAVIDRTVVHLGQSELNAAVSAAQKRKAGDSWAWNRDAPGDAAPLMAASLAFYAVSTRKARTRAVNLADALEASESEQ